ncbi:MATE family efflux transporter [Clostridium sp. MSJ-11]|uniref:Probable multidrug resistance protein NorM n=1 Tax=Clostridium mobile TaxID=2841512 RepID=A0ABS6EKT0_9CLOT|nr:MATE family efflux transporter [Clostridium mobile]MBU5485813.1 MATE family efflux transporter [Clostridium mobile]
MEKTKSSLFRDKEFYNTLMKIALPIIIQNFINSFINMLDTVMVGSLGETAIAAVGIANQYFLLFNLLIIGIYSGCGIFISQFWGKEDTKNIKKMVGMALFTGIMISIVLGIFALIFPREIISFFNKDYKVAQLGVGYLRIIATSYILMAITLCFAFSLRCIGQSSVPMCISVIALISNGILNYAFIFGKLGLPAMGVNGAAIATVISRVIEMMIMVFYVYKTRSVLAIKLRDMSGITKDFIARTFKTVIPVVLNEACWGLATIVYAAVYGRIGTDAIAAVQICSTVQNLFTVVSIGMANASTVMIGNKIGAGQEELGREYAKKFSILGCISGIILGAILALSAPYILKLFNVSPNVAYDARMILYITALVMVIRVFNIILIVGILRGGGDANFALIAEGVTMWFIGVPLSFLGAFVFKLPVYLVVALLTAEEVVKCILGLTRLLSNKWVNNVVYDM